MSEIVKASDLVNNFFDKVEKKDLKQFGIINQCWENVIGIKISSHSRIIDIKKSVLFIEVDHPGWIQTIQLYKSSIINNIKKSFPEIEITSLAFCLKEMNLYKEKKLTRRDILINFEKNNLEDKSNKELQLNEKKELKDLFTKLKKSIEESDIY